MVRKKIRVLVLDDEEERHKYFRSILRNEDATFCYNFDEVLRSLTFEERYDIVMLDHDLGTGNSSAAEAVGLPHCTGYDVAKFIAFDLDKTKRPPRAILHTWNSIGATNMEQVLRQAGIQVQRKPFRVNP